MPSYALVTRDDLTCPTGQVQHKNLLFPSLVPWFISGLVNCLTAVKPPRTRASGLRLRKPRYYELRHGAYVYAYLCEGRGG